MNHEARIAKLEKQVTQLKQIINASGLTEEFIELPKAASILNQTERVIRYRIKKDKSLVIGKHFTLNGSRYLINVEEWRKLIESDARAKLA